MPDVEPHPATWGYIGRRGPRRAADSAGADAGRAGLRGSRGPPQAGAIALRGICGKQQVQPGHQVLINGAGGGSGMYAIQLAKLNGAEVTGVDNAEKLEFMRSLGADRVWQGVQHLAPLVGLVQARSSSSPGSPGARSPAPMAPST